jgi:hypothetical protein
MIPSRRSLYFRSCRSGCLRPSVAWPAGQALGGLAWSDRPRIAGAPSDISDLALTSGRPAIYLAWTCALSVPRCSGPSGAPGAYARRRAGSRCLYGPLMDLPWTCGRPAMDLRRTWYVPGDRAPMLAGFRPEVKYRRHLRIAAADDRRCREPGLGTGSSGVAGIGAMAWERRAGTARWGLMSEVRVAAYVHACHHW